MSSVPKETEIKLTLSPSHLPAVTQWLLSQGSSVTPESLALRNRYFDTPAADLQHQRMALRIRQSGRRFIQTLKTKGQAQAGLHRRNEWEWDIAGWDLQGELLPVEAFPAEIQVSSLACVFETNFQRTQALLVRGDTHIECAIDVGQVLAGSAQMALCEVEFELKAGDEADLWRYAESLAQTVPVLLNPVSKAEQGYFLAGLAGPTKGMALSDGGDVACFDQWLAALGAFHLRAGAGLALSAWGQLLRLESLCRQQGAAIELWRSLVLRQWQHLAAGEHAALLDDPEIGRLQLRLARVLSGGNA